MRKVFFLIAILMYSQKSLAQDIIQVEYFINIDAGFGNNQLITIPNQPGSTYQVFVDLTGISPGRHFLYCRTKDNNGHWSQTIRKGIELYSNSSQQMVQGVEYFFANVEGVSQNTYVAFATPAANGNFVFHIPAGNIPERIDTLFFRSKDNAGHWSQTTSTIKYFTIKDCPANVWLGEVSTDWHTAANWSCNQVPNNSSEVLIVYPTKFFCEVLTGKVATCKKLLQTSGSNVKVNTGASLNIEGL
ncbi:MAG TPA: hypothetical protein PK504_05835 [Ferruginibacter sp.]|nr:hypothetical protein [Ferruginibacter sp.]HRE65040.1 hypothetical protein [Ferruginibacter sp.]